MLRLFSIEFYKLRNSRYFWILAGLFLIFLMAVPIGAKVLLNYLASLGETIVDNFNATELPLFDFVDLWQNLTWVYSFFSIFLGFIMVISICNEYTHGTIKQNVIDGLSRREFLWTKMLFIIVLSFCVSLLVMIIGLIMGYLWSPVKEIEFVLKNIEFIPAYFLHLIAFQTFCMVVSLLIKRPGITIALLTFYVYVIEPIATGIIQYHYEWPRIASLFPSKAIGNIIPVPFPKYIFMQTQTYVGMDDLAILVVYMGVFLFIADRIIVKKDLR